MTEPLIELRNVSKHFAGVKALTDVSTPNGDTWWSCSPNTPLILASRCLA